MGEDWFFYDYTIIEVYVSGETAKGAIHGAI